MTEANRLPHAITKDVDQILPLLVRVDERTIVTHLRTLLWAAALKARPYVLLIIAQFAPAIRCVVTDPNNVIEMIDRTTSAQ
jgi:hypothetical protein